VVEDIENFLGSRETVLLVPYALKEMDLFTKRARARFEKSGHDLVSIHDVDDPVTAIESADAVFVGGGNTFRLVNILYELELLEPLRNFIPSEKNTLSAFQPSSEK